MEKIKTRTAEIWKDEHEIFWVRLVNDAEIDIEDIADNLLVSRTVTANKPVLKIVDSRNNYRKS